MRQEWIEPSLEVLDVRVTENDTDGVGGRDAYWTDAAEATLETATEMNMLDDSMMMMIINMFMKGSPTLG